MLRPLLASLFLCVCSGGTCPKFRGTRLPNSWCSRFAVCSHFGVWSSYCWVGLMWPQRPTRRGGRKGRARSRKLFSWRASSWICTLRSNLRASQRRAQLGSKQWRVRGIEFFGVPGSQCDLLTSLRAVFEGVETRGASRPAGNVQKCVRAEAKWSLGSGYVSMLPLGDVQLFPSGCRSRLFMKGDMRYDGVQAAKETELDGRSVASFAGFARLASLPTWLLS